MMNILINVAEALTTGGDTGGGTRTIGGGGGSGSNIWGVMTTVISILNMVIMVIVAVAVVIFLYGVIKYITAGDSEDKIKEAKNYIIYGIVGLFVMVSVWGLVNVLAGTFNLSDSSVEKPRLLPWRSSGGSSSGGDSVTNLQNFRGIKGLGQ